MSLHPGRPWPNSHVANANGGQFDTSGLEPWHVNSVSDSTYTCRLNRIAEDRGTYDGDMKERIRNWPLWTVIDLALIILFAILGRREHEHALDIGGIFETAVPFLAAYIVMTLISRPWLTINRVWPTGLLVWLGTVAVGMALRIAMGSTAAIAFVIVTILVLGVFLLGRRLICSLLSKRSAKQQNA